MKRFIFCLIMILWTAASYASEWKTSPEVESLFIDEGVQGTFVLYDSANDTLVGHNESRANERFIPASTFKLPNTLIGLATGAVKSVDEVLPYGGDPQPYKAWEHNMGLREALPISNVPIYRELARRIGLKSMRENIEILQYGNMDIGDEVDSFWLKGPLKISPVEQVFFLDKLAKGELPFSKDAQATVGEIALLESGENWSLHAKTGLLLSVEPEIGWWVGWVNKDEAVYPFALNIAIQNPDDKFKRIPLGKEALKILGIIPD